MSGAYPIGQRIRQLFGAPSVFAWGIDYSFGSGLTVAQMQANKVQFVCRYLSGGLILGGHGKDIQATELANILNGGISVVLNWESSGQELGFIAGQRDAIAAEAEVVALAAQVAPNLHAAFTLSEAPIIFSPWDANPAGMTSGINDYMRGAASVRGHDRVGLYQGLPAIKAYFDAGIGKYGWQTYAWSGGVWDPRAQLQQYQNGVTMGPADVDRDRAMAADYGQILATAPKPPPPPPPKPIGPFRHVLKPGQTITTFASSRNTSALNMLARSIPLWTAADKALIVAGQMVVYTVNP